MSGFDFSGNTPTPGEPLTLVNAPFYPQIKSNDFVTQYRIPAEVDVEVIKHQLYMAMIRVNRSLNGYRQQLIDQGVSTLADAEADSVGMADDMESEKVRLYYRAVFCEAKADLLKETETVDRRAVADNLAKTGEETEDKYREFVANAIRAICGQNRVGVHLV